MLFNRKCVNLVSTVSAPMSDSDLIFYQGYLFIFVYYSRHSQAFAHNHADNHSREDIPALHFPAFSKLSNVTSTSLSPFAYFV